jgi:hypothetical protein
VILNEILIGKSATEEKVKNAVHLVRRISSIDDEQTLLDDMTNAGLLKTLSEVQLKSNNLDVVVSFSLCKF